jgi:iron complex transport system substrate-binding protein
VEKIGARLAQLDAEVAQVTERPRVVLLEWLSPFYVGGHWVPEMIARAGGINVGGKAKAPSYRVALEEIVAAAPEVLFVAPCGYDADHARNEYLSMEFPEAWRSIPAVRDGRVFALDANGTVSRPAGRLVTGIEAMAKAMHSGLHVRKKTETVFLPIGEGSRNSRGVSAGS